VDAGKEFQAALRVSLHGSHSGLPIGGADLAVLVVVLDGLDQAEGLVDGPANRHVVDGDLADGAGRVDDEETPEGDAVTLVEDSVGAGDRLVHVLNDGDVHLAEATLLAGELGPSEVGVLGIHYSKEAAEGRKEG